ncbi:hypothetical protein EPI10_025086 [Gossypium australe]|uniref:Uncharacterized protein n=1 Tax=Gossypium australe TaxID=47621 RepID=A0A5B6W147_9ROSI|nr:hypothetical protein EPI10_025086 [Gossypium australe]
MPNKVNVALKLHKLSTLAMLFQREQWPWIFPNLSVWPSGLSYEWNEKVVEVFLQLNKLYVTLQSSVWNGNCTTTKRSAYCFFCKALRVRHQIFSIYEKRCWLCYLLSKRGILI